MSAQSEFTLVFEELKNILRPHAPNLTVKADTANNYYLDGPYSEKWKKEIFFASAQIKKNYVSFYLMPVYMYPELLDGISPELKKHMQGKSCFNFKKVDPDLFRELEKLTQKGAEKFKKETRTMSGQEISFDVNGRPAKGYLAIPSTTPPAGLDDLQRIGARH